MPLLPFLIALRLLPLSLRLLPLVLLRAHVSLSARIGLPAVQQYRPDHRCGRTEGRAANHSY
ncbi:hypothetical protein DMH12_20860 [Streptomyces sp. WAC 04229]|nr:hypothetical protein DMH12_20860 [Streptomyces sp. WAC 04229]